MCVCVFISKGKRALRHHIGYSSTAIVDYHYHYRYSYSYHVSFTMYNVYAKLDRGVVYIITTVCMAAASNATAIFSESNPISWTQPPAMTTRPTPGAVNYNMKLRGKWPLIETDSSNLGIALDQAGGGVNDATLCLMRGSNVPLVLIAAAQGGVYATVSEPFLSFRTATDAYAASQSSSSSQSTTSQSSSQYATERLRVDTDGVWAPVLTADLFTNLVDDYSNNYNVFLPPTANALTSAYITLSNMMARWGGGGGTAVGSNIQPVYTAGLLIDSYTSSSITEPPTANALRAAYYNLSNLLAIKLRALPLAGSSNNNSGGTFQLLNDMWLTSVEGQPRFWFDTDGASVVASSSASATARAFAWFDNTMQTDVMTLSGGGDLLLRGDLMLRGGATVDGASTLLSDVVACGDVSIYSNLSIDGSDLRLGGTHLNNSGSNLGVNLPVGVDPAYSLHVNGVVFSSQQLFALSDRSVKTDIKPIEDALHKLRRIRGFSYMRSDEDDGRRHVGVIAQDVAHAVPEAVHIGQDGKMSVAYGSLVAVAIEAINELCVEMRRARTRLRRLQAIGGRCRRGIRRRVNAYPVQMQIRSQGENANANANGGTDDRLRLVD